VQGRNCIPVPATVLTTLASAVIASPLAAAAKSTASVALAAATLTLAATTRALPASAVARAAAATAEPATAVAATVATAEPVRSCAASGRPTASNFPKRRIVIMVLAGLSRRELALSLSSRHNTSIGSFSPSARTLRARVL
jgi:septal ring-binding cell division protein DamX